MSPMRQTVLPVRRSSADRPALPSLLQLPVSIRSPTRKGDHAPHQPGLVSQVLFGAARIGGAGNSRLLQALPNTLPIVAASAQLARGAALRRRCSAASRALGESSATAAGGSPEVPSF